MRARPPKRRGAARQYPQLYDVVWLKAQIDAGRTYGSIASEVGCTPANVSLCVRKVGLGRRCRPHRRPNMRQPVVIRVSEEMAKALKREVV